MKKISLDLHQATEKFNEVYENISELGLNGIEIEAVSEVTPMPWDAGIEISELQVRDSKIMTAIISGSVDAGGLGSCQSKLPLKYIHSYYWVYVMVENELDAAKVKYYAEQAGVKIIEGGK
jgi:hypothetical protein